MKKDRLIKNYIFNTSYQMLALLVPLVTAPYTSRVLGAEGIGLQSYTYSIVGYFALIASLGSAVYGSKMISILRDDPIARTEKFWDVFILRIIMSLPMLLLYYLYAFLFAPNKVFALIQSIYIFEVIFNVSWLFQGVEDFKKIVIRNYIVKIINIAFIFIFIKEPSDLWKYTLGLTILCVAGNIFTVPFIFKYLVKLKNYRPHPFRDMDVILQLFIPTVAFQLYVMMDKILIRFITGSDTENGYYEQTDKIVRMSLVLINGVNAVVLPQMSKSYHEKNNEESINFLYKSYRFVWFIGFALMFGAIGVSNMLVPIFFGDGFDKIKILLPILSTLFVLVGMNEISGSLYFISAGKQTVYTAMLLFAGVVNAAVDIILIPKLQSVGAAIGAIAGQVVLLIVEIIYLKKTEKIRLGNLFVLKYKYIWCGFAMLATLLLLNSVLTESAVNLLVLICSGSFVYFFLLLILKDEFIDQIFMIVRKIVGKVRNK